MEIRKETQNDYHAVERMAQEAFMAIELIPEKMKEIRGKFYEAEVFEQSDDGLAEEYNQKFKPMKKLYFPSQW